MVGTGVITIPLIKKRGFSSHFAAAVEAAASSGGQITPPIMGAVAFIMADITGVPYLTICLAALVPALLYYFGLFVAISRSASSIELEEIEMPNKAFSLKEIIQILLFILSLGSIVFFMVTGASAAYSGFIGCLIALILGLIISPNLLSDRTAWLSFIASCGRISAQLIVI